MDADTGNYVLEYWGCGTACSNGAVIDTATCEVTWLPLEVFTGSGRRQDWPEGEKARIVAEGYEIRESVSAMARRYALSVDAIDELAAKAAVPLLPSAPAQIKAATGS
jgi:hypothetical protein